MGRSPKEDPDEGRAALARLIELFCARHHEAPEGQLCDICADLLAYAARRAERCTHDPKPKCKACSTHCHGPGYRDKIRAVMRAARTSGGNEE